MVLLAGVTSFAVVRSGAILDEHGQPLSRDAIDQLTNELSDRLSGAVGVRDQSMDINLGTGHVEIYVDVPLSPWQAAIDAGDAAIRTALHAAGIATPIWEGDDEIPHKPAPGATLHGGTISVHPNGADLIVA